MAKVTGVPLSQHSPSYDVSVNQQMIDARRVIVNQDASPVVSVVAIAAEARHSEITGQLSMEHQEQLRQLYNERHSEVSR